MGILMDMINDVLMDTIHDTLPMLPLLFLTYLVLEYVERKEAYDTQKKLLSLQRFGPLFGAFLGVIPQCGFSVIAAGLYVDRAISLGTMIAVFISTSDEAIPILLAHPDQASLLPMIIIIKIVLAIVVGYSVDSLFKRTKFHDKLGEKESLHCSCETHEHSVIIDALLRTIKIFIFVFVVNFILSMVIAWIGEDRLGSLLLEKSVIQPLLAAILGFIPNCAASVILAQLYVSGVVSFGALCAGLVTSAGLGLMVLIKADRNKKEIGIILLILLISAWFSGTLIQCIEYL